jgi:hypothetical protein
MNVGLIGPKHVGKSTVAEGFHRAGYTRLSLAGPVKAAAHAALDCIVDHLGLPPLPTDFPTTHKEAIRPLYQWLGTDLVRDALRQPHFWIDRLLDEVDRYEAVVVDDVRFPNEAIALRQAGFVLIRVVRPGLRTNDTHPSETHVTDIDDWDYLLFNDYCTVAELVAHGERIANALLTDDPKLEDYLWSDPIE